MCVHNSAAGNVIHLFTMWCGVLQHRDERKSAWTWGRVRVTRRDEAEKDAWRTKKKEQKTKGGNDDAPFQEKKKTSKKPATV